MQTASTSGRQHRVRFCHLRPDGLAHFVVEVGKVPLVGPFDDAVK
jgi:hypothetical protein